MANEHLTIYLQDHLAGSTAGAELAKRAASNNEGTGFAEPLERIAAEIEEDRETLKLIMAELGIQPDVVKDAGGWIAEKFARLKLNGSLTSYSPLSRLIELEGLMLGVTGKRAVWQSLQASLGAEAIGAADITELAERADRHRTELEELRRKAAAEALSA